MIFIHSDQCSVPHQLQPVLQITMSSYKSSDSRTDSRTGSRVPEGHRRFPDGSIAPANSKFCKVCYDAGCSVADYTNHFVKSQPGPDGVVVCPTLMSQKCRICHNPGHTSSYCPRYIPREERRPRDDERRPREEERRPREEERRPRYDDRRDISFNRLREDTERHEREIRDRDDHYYRQQDRNSKQWLQAALRPASSSSSRQQHGYDDNRKHHNLHHHNPNHHQQRSGPTAPYAHPHNLRVRLQLEQQAMSAYASHNKIDLPAVPAAPAIDMRQVELGHAPKWSDEDAGAEMLFQKFAAFVNVRDTGNDEYMSREEDDFMMACDNQSGKCFPDSPRF